MLFRPKEVHSRPVFRPKGRTLQACLCCLDLKGVHSRPDIKEVHCWPDLKEVNCRPVLKEVHCRPVSV